MVRILVVGGASLDRLHLSGQVYAIAGGAGLYTAVAAYRCGGHVTLFAPRPYPMPDSLRTVNDLVRWEGPVVRPSELPRFEYTHDREQATFMNAFIGAEADMTPDMLPADLSSFDAVHVIPLGKSSRQLAFLQACRVRGASRLSAGTFKQGILDEPEAIRAILAISDYFFLNESEAAALFGKAGMPQTEPGKVLFVTQGSRGARVVQGDYSSPVAAVPVRTLDPTGAGDTFCGATLTELARGAHPVQAARRAMPLAARTVTGIGPAKLLDPATGPVPRFEKGVRVDAAQIRRVATLIASLPEVRPFDFTGPDFPEANHPATLDFFFAAVLQQFGFWSLQDGRYAQPFIAPIDGRRRKGSSFLFRAYRRCLQNDPGFFTPERQANLTRAELSSVLRPDDGEGAMPALDLHLAQARAYGCDMVALGLRPRRILAQAIAASRPLQFFLARLDHVGGYKEDPVRKKSTLLALILNQRPEGFLSFAAGEQAGPVIDYHLMRSCLRVGLIDVVDDQLSQELVARRQLDSAGEWAVRAATYEAIQQIVTLSGKSMGAVDWFFFNARHRCPEMTEPECLACALDPVCAHHKTLFQPVLRTTFY